MAMAHQRMLIRKAVVAMLIAANTDAGSRVKPTRVEPHKKSQLPAIAVYTLSEDIDDELSRDSAPRELTRSLKLEIAAWVADSEAVTVDDAMDNIAAEIEAAMDADWYLTDPTQPSNGSTAANSILIGTEMQVVEDDGRSDPLVGIVTLTFDVTYRTDSATNGAVADFSAAHATYLQPGGQPDTVPVQDQFTVET